MSQIVDIAPTGRSGNATTQRTGSQAGGAIFLSADLINAGNEYEPPRTIVKDMGNPLVIEERDAALGRAFEIEDQTSTLRQFKRDSEKSIIKKMEHFGVSFVTALANAARHADLVNYERLRNAFPHYWKSYSDDQCRTYK